jgi:predicted  nucleic acid-binding Zn-ribbon protein
LHVPATSRSTAQNSSSLLAGPLEATVAKLQRELAAKESAARDLQRRWIGVQGQLVAAQADGAELEEAVAGMRAQQAVMQQKRARLESQ